MSSILRINSITSRSGINTLDFTGNGFSYVTDVGFGTTSPRGKLDVQGTFLANGGNAGIGTTLPTSRLDVVGDVQVSGVVTATSFRGDGSNLTGVAATSNIRTNAIVNSGVTTVSAGSASIPSISPSGDPNTGIFFPTTNTVAISTGGFEALRVTGIGSVGIGVTTPNSRLTIKSFGASTTPLNIQNSGNTSIFRISQSSGGSGILELRDSTDKTYMTADSSTGFVGIGSTNPDSILYVGFGDDAIINGSANARLVVNDSGTGQADVFVRNHVNNVMGRFTATTGSCQVGSITNHPVDFCINNTIQLKFTTTGDLVSQNASDLGSFSQRWGNIFTNDLHLSNEGSQNDIDGTWGNYTIQEGENDLFLINRRNGKKYKFVLQEVN